MAICLRIRSSVLICAGLRKVEFASLDWQIHKIDIPYLSVRKKFLLDQKIFDAEPQQIVENHGMWFDKDAERSAGTIIDYVRLYRFYPHFSPDLLLTAPPPFLSRDGIKPMRASESLGETEFPIIRKLCHFVS